MAKTERYILNEINRQDGETLDQIGASELIFWYQRLPLRRVRRLCRIPLHWRDQADYPPMAARIKLYEDFLAMTEGKEEEATYTLGYRHEHGCIPGLYVVETYEYPEESTGHTIEEARWYGLFTSPNEYTQATGHTPQQDIGHVLTLAIASEQDALFTIHGYAMTCRGGLREASFYTKTWYIIEGIVRTSILQEKYQRKGGYLQMVDCTVYGTHE